MSKRTCYAGDVTAEYVDQEVTLKAGYKNVAVWVV